MKFDNNVEIGTAGGWYLICNIVPEIQSVFSKFQQMLTCLTAWQLTCLNLHFQSEIFVWRKLLGRNICMAKAVLGKLLSGESCFGGNLSGGNIISLQTVVLLSNSQPIPKQGVDFTFPQ